MLKLDGQKNSFLSATFCLEYLNKKRMECIQPVLRIGLTIYY